MSEFSRRTRNLRNSMNLRQKDLAEFLGTSKQVVSNYENEQREPSFDVLIRIAQFFSVSTDYLLGVSPLENQLLGLVNNRLEAPVTEDEVIVAIPPVMEKLQRIIQREGDADGVRLKPQYIAKLIAEHIRNERFAAECQLRYMKKQSAEFCVG
jgi:transcriptional regulator with XRE-family HTH domain